MEPMFELINHAVEMLKARPKIEQDLIYAIAKLPDELRAAIILAYQNIHTEVQ